MDNLQELQRALDGRYAVERELGRGGMATVYLARDLKHERRVAIKVLHRDVSQAVGSGRFLREIAIVAQLQHPHILGLHESGEAGGLLYYVMPYVEGESLRDRLDHERQLPIDEAVRIALEVADALGHAHTLGLVHRDIKPDNILLSGGHAIIADFGIATALTVAAGEKLTQTGTAIGTPQYMSPEQAAGERVDGRCDLYALGCVLYEMLAGGPPFTGPTSQAILARHAVDPVPSLRTVRGTVSPGLEWVIDKVLAKVPADRFATAAEFADAVTHPERAPVGRADRRRLVAAR
ncbi:MAG: serine/threonine-protein kinase [Gemmatimonadales bacterium]